MCGATRLVPNHGLLDGGQILERRQQDVAPLGPANVVDEGAQFLAQGDEHLVLVLDRFCNGIS